MYVATMPAPPSVAPRVESIRVSPETPSSDREVRIEVLGSDIGPPRTGKLSLRTATGESWVEIRGSDPVATGCRLIWHLEGPVELILEPSFLRSRPEGRHQLELLIENADGVSCWQPLTLVLRHAEARFFRWTELEDRGVALAPGRGWDRRLEGALSPCAVGRTSAGYVMSYIGAAGDRRDGGACRRQLGLAFSGDGLQFRKGVSPVLSVPTCHGSGVDGILSAAVATTDGLTEVLYSTLRSRSGGHCVDIWRGISRGQKVWRQRRVIAGDCATLSAVGEDFLPVAAVLFRSGHRRRRLVYALARRSTAGAWRPWALELRGDVLSGLAEIIGLGSEPVRGMAGPVRLGDGRLGFLLARGPKSGPWTLEHWTASIDRPTELTSAGVLLEGAAFRHAAVLLERQPDGRSRWLVYLEEVQGRQSRYRVLTADVFGA